MGKKREQQKFNSQDRMIWIWRVKVLAFCLQQWAKPFSVKIEPANPPTLAINSSLVWRVVYSLNNSTGLLGYLPLSLQLQPDRPLQRIFLSKLHYSEINGARKWKNGGNRSFFPVIAWVSIDWYLRNRRWNKFAKAAMQCLWAESRNSLYCPRKYGATCT